MKKTKLVWVWLKAYWYIPLSIAGALLLFFLGSKTALGDVGLTLKKRKAQHKKEINIIETSYKKKQEAFDKNKIQYDRSIQELERQYSKKISEISRSEKKRLKALVKEYEDQPDMVAKRMAKEYGWEFVK